MDRIFANRKRYEEMKPLLRQIEEETTQAKTAPDYKIMATEYARKCLDQGIQKYFEDHDMFTLKYFMDLFHSWDESGYIPKNVGKYLEALMKDDRFVVGIHRTSVVESPSILQDIFSDGLTMTGDLSSGVDERGQIIHPSKHILPIRDEMDIVVNLKTDYRSAVGGIIVAIPKEYVDENMRLQKGQAESIYNITEEGYCKLKPEYLLGYVVQENKECTFYSKNQIQNKAKAK